MPKFREITGQFVGYIPDGIDPDIVPDRAPMNGRVTFTPVFTGGVIAFPELSPPEFARPEPIRARIVDGFVRVEVGVDETLTLQPLSLMVTVDDEASQVWSWRAEFDEILIGASDEYVKIPAWSFRVPDGVGPVDLTELVPLKTSATVDVTKGPRGAGLQNITAVDGQLVFEYTDGEETVIPVPEAVQGPPGADGAPGPQGETGEQGPEGPQGPAPDLLVGNITDATPVGKNLMLAATEGAARNALGLQAGATAISGSLEELNTGTSNTARVWTPRNLSETFLHRNIAKTSDDGQPLLHIVDTSTNPHDTFRLDDSPNHTADVINISHFGTSPNGEQAYAINIANNPGASGAFIIHQYSKAQPAIQLDNTDVASTIFIRNTQNQTMNPGGQGTGPFLQFMPYGQTQSLFFTDGLQWVNNTSKDMRFRAMNPSVYGLGVQVDTDKTGLQVMKNGTGAGAALAVNNKGTGAGVSIVQSGAGDGMRVIQLNSGSYAARYEGQNYGISTIVTGDGGIAFDITKSGTGNGTALRVANKGTGDILAGTDGTANTYKIKFNGETEQFASGVGHVMRSPDGTRYRVTVNNAGELTVSPA